LELMTVTSSKTNTGSAPAPAEPIAEPTTTTAAAAPTTTTGAAPPSAGTTFEESSLGSYVKIVDMRDENAAAIFTQSLKDTGFAVLTNHGLQVNIYDEWREFFKSGNAAQDKYSPNGVSQDGYFSTKHAESAKGAKVNDLKQYYQLYFPDGRYPDEVSSHARDMFFAMLALGGTLLDWIDDHMDPTVRQQVYDNLRKNEAKSGRVVEGAQDLRIADLIDPRQTMLRILRYPPLGEVEVREHAVRAAAHEDINLITLLPAGSGRGLEVKDMEGNWHEVPMCENSMIVNIGDMLQEMTNGEYKATTHRVVVPDDEDGSVDRMSCPCFIHPLPGTYLSDTWTDSLDYLHNRLTEQGVALKKQ
jgi:isopenicillin N synthase-like dioxygenase